MTENIEDNHYFKIDHYLNVLFLIKLIINVFLLFRIIYVCLHTYKI